MVIDTPGASSSEMMMPGGLLKPILSMWILASISEEIFFRGFLQSFFMPLKKYGLLTKI
jgi:membrane protease YdiL (CAAX protease family)